MPQGKNLSFSFVETFFYFVLDIRHHHPEALLVKNGICNFCRVRCTDTYRPRLRKTLILNTVSYLGSHIFRNGLIWSFQFHTLLISASNYSQPYGAFPSSVSPWSFPPSLSYFFLQHAFSIIFHSPSQNRTPRALVVRSKLSCSFKSDFKLFIPSLHIS